MKNSIGNNITMTIFGESHGPCVGVTLDGLPSGFKIDLDFLYDDMEKRRAVGLISTQRHEEDHPEIVSGFFNGYTTGTPLTLLIANKDQHSKDYEKIKGRLRPGHADYTAFQRYNGYQDYRGGGATSGMVSGSDKCFPFEVYSLPYLRCHVRLLMDSNRQIGKFRALAHVNYMSSSQTEVVLNFIGPDGGDSFLFSVSNPQSDSSVDIYGYSHRAMEEDAKMTDADRQAVLSKRMEIQLNNVVCNMNALQFTISVAIDTSEYIFPISGFFDIMLRSSTIVISQKIKFMPGSSFFADENSVVALSYNDQRSAQVLALGNNYYYYDSQYEKFVNNDYMDGGEGSQGRQYRRSEAFAKYFSSPRISIYGTLAIRQGNAGSNSSPYILAGNINFNRVAYYSDDLSALTYVDYEERENPFTELVSDSLGTTSISTYYFSTMLGSVTGFPSYKTYFCKGYSLPLVSNGLCYYQNATDTDGMVGTFDSRIGEMLFNGSHYVIESTKSYSSAPREDGSCSLLKVTKDSALPVYQDENGEQYIFFAGMYCKFSSSTDSTGEADCSRLTDTTQKTAVKFDSSLNRWVRA